MHHGVTFNFGCASECVHLLYLRHISHDKDIWIAATDYYMYIYITVLFPLTSILQLINFTAS